MKKIVLLLPILLGMFINSAHGAVIIADFGEITPLTITNEVDLVADFGTSGTYTDFSNILISLAFDQNILDTNDTLSISYKGPGLLFNVIDFTTDRPINSIVFNLYAFSVNTDGKSIISISANNNGINLSTISLSGNAMITAVPLPPSILLLFSGFLAMLIKAKR